MCRAPEHSRRLVNMPFPSRAATDFAYHLLPKAQEVDMICVETGLGWGVQDRRGGPQPTGRSSPYLHSPSADTLPLEVAAF